jgi:hypothetical protein
MTYINNLVTNFCMYVYTFVIYFFYPVLNNLNKLFIIHLFES